MGGIFNEPVGSCAKAWATFNKAGVNPCWSAAGQVGGGAKIVDAQRIRNVTGGERPAGEIHSRHRRSKCAVIFFCVAFFCLLLLVWLVGPPLQVPRVPEVSYQTRSLRSSGKGSVFSTYATAFACAALSFSPLRPFPSTVLYCTVYIAFLIFVAASVHFTRALPTINASLFVSFTIRAVFFSWIPIFR